MSSFRVWWDSLDVADRTMFLRIAFPSWAILSAVEFTMLDLRSAELVVLIAVVNPIIAGLLARLSFTMIASFANAAVLGLSGDGGDPYKVGFSAQEAMVVRGEWQNAIISYSDMLMTDPLNHEARLRMARLQLRNGSDIEAAEQHYLMVRRDDLAGTHDATVSNALIDLYRAAGRREEMRRELTRAAQRNPGTTLGDGARHALRAMANEEAPGESS